MHVNDKTAIKVCDLSITGGIARAVFVFLHISSLRTVVHTPCKDVHGENFAIYWVLVGLCTYIQKTMPKMLIELKPSSSMGSA